MREIDKTSKDDCVPNSLFFVRQVNGLSLKLSRISILVIIDLLCFHVTACG